MRSPSAPVCPFERVENHLQHVYEKLGLTRRGELADVLSIVF